jgi:hypothetical protein
MGMTWRLKVLRVAFVLAVIAGLALAVGADWFDSSYTALF